MKIKSADVRMDREIDEVKKVMATGNLREGVKCAEFEDAFREKAGADHAVSIQNGTVALMSVYQHAFQPGDEVLVPSFTFFATVAPLVLLGIKPVFCDIDPISFTLSTEDAESKITSRTKGIVGVHLYGHPAEVNGILELKKKHGLFVVWDAAQAQFAKYKGADIGSFEDAVCYSFYATKNMTTGEGGMVLTPHEELADKIRLFKRQGQSKKYYHSFLGINLRMTDMQGAIGLVQLQKIDQYNALRRENAEYYNHRFSEIGCLSCPYPSKDVAHVYHLYTLLLKGAKANITRDEIVERMKEKGVDTSVNYPIPVHKQPVFEKDFGDISLPHTKEVADNCFSIPVHPFLTVSEREYICDSLIGILES